jgi:hypothetical protein
MAKSNSHLFGMNVSLTSSNEIAINLDYPEPSAVHEELSGIDEKFHANILSAVIRHCKSNAEKLNYELKDLLERL